MNLFARLLFILLWTVPVFGANSNRCQSLFLPSQRNPVGLEALRELINEKGVTLALDWNKNEVDLSESDLWYVTGARAILADGLKTRRKIPGVVLHLGSNNLKKNIYGDYNPTMTSTRMAKRFENKINEARYMLETDPKNYPKTIFVSDLKLDRIKPSEISRDVVFARAQDFFARMQNEFPQGFIVKHAFEFKSGDSKTGPVLSGKATPEKLVSHFFSKLSRLRNIKLGEKNFEKKLFVDDWDPYFAVTYALLLTPENLMVQEKLKISEEFREDYVAGEVDHVQPRYDRAYDSENGGAAKEFLDGVLQNPNGKLKVAAGGADIAYIESENKFTVIELNLGGESAYVDPLYLPVSANIYMSTLLGYDTPLIRDLNQVRRQSINVRTDFIAKFARKFLKHLDRDARRDAISEFEDYLGLAPQKNKRSK